MAVRTISRGLVVLVLTLGTLVGLAGGAGAEPPWWTPPGSGEPPAPPDPALDLIGSWDGSISDGEGLCYTIALPNNFEFGFDASAAIRDAIDDWVAPVNALSTRDLTLTDGTTNGCTSGVDVAIIVRRGGGRIQGTTSFESSAGLITGTQIVVRGNFAGTQNTEDEIELIARHEFGHALGLGHWNVDDQLMSPELNATDFINDCEAQAVVTVQGWYLNGVGGPAPYAGANPYGCDPNT